jgi:hypothetical protein
MTFKPNNMMVKATVEMSTPFADLRQFIQLNIKNNNRLGNTHQLITNGRRLPINIRLGNTSTSRLLNLA